MRYQTVQVVAKIVDDGKEIASSEIQWRSDGLGAGYNNNALLNKTWAMLDGQAACAATDADNLEISAALLVSCVGRLDRCVAALNETLERVAL